MKGLKRLWCRWFGHDDDLDYEFPSYIEPAGFWSTEGGFPYATVVNESSGRTRLVCERCGRVTEWK